MLLKSPTALTRHLKSNSVIFSYSSSFPKIKSTRKPIFKDLMMSLRVLFAPSFYPVAASKAKITHSNSKVKEFTRFYLQEANFMLLYTGSSFSLWKVTKIIFLFHQNYFSRKKFCGYRFRLHVLLLKLSTVSINSLLRRVEFIDFCGWFLHASFLSDHFWGVIHMGK